MQKTKRKTPLGIGWVELDKILYLNPDVSAIIRWEKKDGLQSKFFKRKKGGTTIGKQMTDDEIRQTLKEARSVYK